MAIYLYFTGFTYRYYYYDHFGLRNLIADPSPYNAFVLSYGVLSKHWIVMVALVILIFSILTAVRQRTPRMQRRIAGVAAVLTALALFPLLNTYAAERAHEDARWEEGAASHGKDTRISIAPGNIAKDSPYFINAANGYDVHILARDERNTYILWQLSSREGDGEIFVVPNGDIKYGEMFER